VIEVHDLTAELRQIVAETASAGARRLQKTGIQVTSTDIEGALAALLEGAILDGPPADESPTTLDTERTVG
jgi:hypothetical protein